MNKDQLNIFLADDDDDDRLLFCEALDELETDTRVTTFENGVDLMANLIDKEIALPDMIFLDLNMPLMNGEECLTDIKQEPALSDIPIVIYSTSLDPHMAEILLEKGANRYLQKPKSYTQLKASLERSLETIHQNQSKPSSMKDFIIKV